MAIQVTEGVVLRTLPFQEKGQILFLFTPDRGVIKLLHVARSGGRGQKNGLFLSPLMRVETLFVEKTSDWLAAKEMTVIESFLSLREQLLFLETGCELLQSISQVDFLHAPCQELYALLLFYLKKIPSVVDPRLLSSSFRLKLLKHEGFASFPFSCAECGDCLLEGACFWRSDMFCMRHAPSGEGTLWDTQELLWVYTLAESQSFQAIGALFVSPSLHLKVHSFFQAALF